MLRGIAGWNGVYPQENGKEGIFLLLKTLGLSGCWVGYVAGGKSDPMWQGSV